jgi:hypothetical protein
MFMLPALMFSIPARLRRGRPTEAGRAGLADLRRDSKYQLSDASGSENLPIAFALYGSKTIISDRRFYGINYFVGSTGPGNTGHSSGVAGCGDNAPSCG